MKKHREFYLLPDEKCYFLREDFHALEKRIHWLKEQIRINLHEMGVSCEEGAETFHDNFAFEDGDRAQRMWSDEIRRLVIIKDHGVVIDLPLNNGRVAIGRTLTIEDEDTGELRTFKIGSHTIFTERGGISYKAPLAKAFIGAEEGENREVDIGGEKKSYIVVKIV